MYESGYFAAVEPAFLVENPWEISYDPRTVDQWALYNATAPAIDISVSTAWNYSTGRNIKVAVIDSGCDIFHEDLFSRIYKSFDMHTKTSPCKINDAHGTMCTGIISAIRNNDKGIAGVAPDALLMPVSVMIDSIDKPDLLAQAISWAWKNGADIISCSWGSSTSQLIKEAIEEAATYGRNGKGCIIVSSAGNIHPNRPSQTGITFPAILSEVIAVGNLDKDGMISSSSCYGPNMCVVAPGTDIISTTLDNGYAEESGTSLACPHVAGVAALILQRNPNLKAADVRDIIVKSAQKIGPLNKAARDSWDQKYGYGLVNACKAVMNTPRK